MGDAEQGASEPQTQAHPSGPSQTQTRKKFSEEELAKASEEVDKMLENEGEFLECGVSGALTVHSVEAATVPVATGTSAPSGTGKRKKKSSATSATASKPAAVAVENPWLSVSSNNGTAPSAADGSAASVAAVYS